MVWSFRLRSRKTRVYLWILVLPLLHIYYSMRRALSFTLWILLFLRALSFFINLVPFYLSWRSLGICSFRFISYLRFWNLIWLNLLFNIKCIWNLLLLHYAVVNVLPWILSYILILNLFVTRSTFVSSLLMGITLIFWIILICFFIDIM